MNLIINSKKARQLAYEIMAITGETLPEAVTTALSERLERLKTKKATAEDLLKAAEACRPYVNKDEGGIVLYDEQGLSK